VQNICQNMAQNSTVLQQWRSPHWGSELLSHQVCAHIKHSTTTTIVSKIKRGYAHFSAILYNCTNEYDKKTLQMISIYITFCEHKSVHYTWGYLKHPQQPPLSRGQVLCYQWAWVECNISRKAVSSIVAAEIGRASCRERV
jgi:hypothetical protein